MERPELDNDRKFAGGIFSGAMQEEEKQETDGGRFFNYATLPQKNMVRMSFAGSDSMEEREEYQKSQTYFMQPGVQGQDPYHIPEKESCQEDGKEYQESGASQENGEYRYSSGYQGNRFSPGYGEYQGSRASQGNGEYRYNSGYQEDRFSSGYGKYQGNRAYQGCGGYPGNSISQGYGGAWGFHGCMDCPNRGKKEHSAVVIMAIVAVAALVVAFLAVIFCLVKISSYQQMQPIGVAGNGEAYYYGESDPSRRNGNKWYEDIPAPDNGDDYYGEITDAVREDLDYSITWENYEYEGNNDSVTIAVDYPVIIGDIPNIDVINDIIDDETEYFENYYEEYVKNISEGRFLVYSEGYVTYMDEEVMSVVFAEMVYTDYWTDYGLYCLNIDVENGVVMDNSSIIEIDDEFAVDFRKRCKQQNGMVDELEYMSDQEIAYYLSQEGTSIMFYTPMGMEVGLNMGGYYVTVTYKDYEKFQQWY